MRSVLVIERLVVFDTYYHTIKVVQYVYILGIYYLLE